MGSHQDGPRESNPGAETSTRRVHTTTAADTQRLAEDLATVLADGDLIVMAGDLGAGKTCFTQGLGRGLGIAERITSPTFTIHSRYDGRLTLNHLDVYRIDQLEDTLDLDLPELLEEGVTVIEWGEQIDPVLPAHLVIRIEFGDNDDDRTISFISPGNTELDAAWSKRLGEAESLRRWWASC